MKKYHIIVKALLNLERASEERNKERNIHQDHAEWLILEYFTTAEFPVLHFTSYKPGLIIKDIKLFFRKYDTTPFVYLNLN